MISLFNIKPSISTTQSLEKAKLVSSLVREGNIKALRALDNTENN